MLVMAGHSQSVTGRQTGQLVLAKLMQETGLLQTGRPGKLTVAGRGQSQAGQFPEDSLLHLSSKQESLKRKAWKTPADKYAHKGVDCKKVAFRGLSRAIYTDKKENKTFLINKENQMGAVSK